MVVEEPRAPPPTAESLEHRLRQLATGVQTAALSVAMESLEADRNELELENMRGRTLRALAEEEARQNLEKEMAQSVAVDELRRKAASLFQNSAHTGQLQQASQILRDSRPDLVALPPLAAAVLEARDGFSSFLEVAAENGSLDGLFVLSGTIPREEESKLDLDSARIGLRAFLEQASDLDVALDVAFSAHGDAIGAGAAPPIGPYSEQPRTDALKATSATIAAVRALLRSFQTRTSRACDVSAAIHEVENRIAERDRQAAQLEAEVNNAMGQVPRLDMKREQVGCELMKVDAQLEARHFFIAGVGPGGGRDRLALDLERVVRQKRHAALDVEEIFLQSFRSEVIRRGARKRLAISLTPVALRGLSAA
mmetsp:Transcript_42975/g.138129  ORF Transcript_42975/g.138129 Transcript_42975/m.138129 type:complete len:368 (-) Transcript_42975:143-1246(-)